MPRQQEGSGVRVEDGQSSSISKAEGPDAGGEHRALGAAVPCSARWAGRRRGRAAGKGLGR